MSADTTDIRYVRTENLWHLVTDYFYFTGSKAGEMISKVCLQGRSTAHFLTYADAPDCARAILTAKSSIDGIKLAIDTFVEDEAEKEALCAVLTAIADLLEGDTIYANRSYPAAVEAIQNITPKDPPVHWEASSKTFFWAINEWIDEVPIIVEQKNDRWVWSLSRDRGQGIETTRDAAMRAGEAALGWSEKPVKV